MPGGIGGTSALAISPDGSILAAGSYDTNVRAWTTRNGELLRLIEDLPVAMFAMAFTKDGHSWPPRAPIVRSISGTRKPGSWRAN